MKSEDLLDNILRKRRCMGRGGKEGTSPPGVMSLSLEELRALKERQGTHSIPLILILRIDSKIFACGAT